jgi:hypothetical protein
MKQDVVIREVSPRDEYKNGYTEFASGSRLIILTVYMR